MSIPSPNLTQTDGGIRNDKPRLLRLIAHNSSQQSSLLKLVQRAANGSPGDRAPCFTRFVVEYLGSDAPVRVPEQQPCDGDPLPSRTQPNPVQEVRKTARP